MTDDSQNQTYRDVPGRPGRPGRLSLGGPSEPVVTAHGADAAVHASAEANANADAAAIAASWVRRLARARVPLGFASGLAVLWFAQPTPMLLEIGLPIALLGEALRIWAAGHLEKSREVTQSGPYRIFRHPLYVGSSVMGVGLAVAAGSVIVTLLVLIYLIATLGAAVRTEEAFLRTRFGADYDAYRQGRVAPARREFSVARAMRNREYRAIAGVLLAALLLCAKWWWLRS
jgi:protein-S-isoprenylcysteine O-methyltransferase Ste14